MNKSKNKKTNFLIDPRSDIFRQVQYDLYHTNLELKCPMCKKNVAHLSDLGEHMRKSHAHSYLSLQKMKRHACSRFYKLCESKEERMVINWIDAEFAEKIDNFARPKNKKRRIPMGPDRLPWPKFRTSGSSGVWSALSKASNPIIMYNMG